MIETFERFEEEFGVDPHFRQHGYLILVATDEELALAERTWRSSGAWAST